MIQTTRDIINQVREYLDRHLDAIEIARRMNLEPSDIQTIIDLINNILT